MVLLRTECVQEALGWYFVWKVLPVKMVIIRSGRHFDTSVVFQLLFILLARTMKIFLYALAVTIIIAGVEGKI